MSRALLPIRETQASPDQNTVGACDRVYHSDLVLKLSQPV